MYLHGKMHHTHAHTHYYTPHIFTTVAQLTKASFMCTTCPLIAMCMIAQNRCKKVPTKHTLTNWILFCSFSRMAIPTIQSVLVQWRWWRRKWPKQLLVNARDSLSTLALVFIILTLILLFNWNSKKSIIVIASFDLIHSWVLLRSYYYGDGSKVFIIFSLTF